MAGYLYRYILTAFLCLWTCGSWAQTDLSYVDIPDASTQNVGMLADFIRENYGDTRSRLWGLYKWEAQHIKYNLSTRDEQLRLTKEEDLAQWTLTNRMGVCANFSQLFAAVARRLGIEVYIVTGYVVTMNNVRDDGHEWCACIIDDKPYIFDPTWGGGYMLNNVQYVPNLNPQYFMVDPQKMIYSHMPEDPLFQFLNYPKSYDEIDNPGKTYPLHSYFSWRDTLNAYNIQTPIERLGGQIYRMRHNGFANDWIANEIQRMEYNYSVHLYNQESDRFAALVDNFNGLVAYVNANCKPYRPLSSVLSQIDNLRTLIPDIADHLEDVEPVSEQIDGAVLQMQQHLDKLSDELDDIEVHVRNYYKQNKK